MKEQTLHIIWHIGMISAIFCMVLFIMISSAKAAINVGDSDMDFGVVIPDAVELITEVFGKKGNPPYLYNDTNIMYFNETFLNATIDDRATGGSLDNTNIAYQNQTNNFSLVQNTGNIEMLAGGDHINSITFAKNDVFENEVILKNQFSLASATIRLPTATTVLNGRSTADTNTIMDSFTATPVSMKVAQCIEHYGDRDNQICFPGPDKQEFNLGSGITYMWVNRNGGKTNLLFDVYGVDWTVGTGDFIVDGGGAGTDIRLLTNGSVETKGIDMDGIVSLTVTETGALSSPVNCFDMNSYAAYTYVNNTDMTNFVYDQTAGTFTVNGLGGLYEISITGILSASAVDEYLYNLTKNDIPFYEHDFEIHSDVDPVERSLTILQDFTDQDVFEWKVHNTDGVDNAACQDGTTINIVKIR
jgi:hypothetical protein